MTKPRVVGNMADKARMWVCLLSLHLLLPVRELRADDSATLKMLYLAQVAAESAFPSGELHATVVDEWAKREADVVIQWRGESCYIRATCKETMTLSEEQIPEVREVEQIYTPGVWIFSEPKAKIVQRVLDKRMSGWSQLKLMPKDAWFCLAPESQRTWSQKLKQQMDPGGPWTTDIQELPDGVWEVTDTDKQSGDLCVTVYDTRKAGNVVRYECIPVGESNQYRLRGEYGWAYVDDSRWALKSYTYQLTTRADENFEKCPSFSIKVKEFNPNPSISVNRFEMSSLTLRKGTLVEELGAKERRYRIGDKEGPEAGISEEVFRALIEIGKDKGFGAAK
ncbi:MAG: hypothetical protein ACK58L_19355 [Planctomycetota bacterium]